MLPLSDGRIGPAGNPAVPNSEENSVNTVQSAESGQVFVFFQPVPGGMAVKRTTPPPQWFEAGHEKLRCAACGADLRPEAADQRPAFNVPDPQIPDRMRLFCGRCCNDGIDEMERLTGRPGRVTGVGRVPGQRLSEPERAAQRRIGGVIRSCGVFSKKGLAMWRENGCGQFKATADEIAGDLAVLGVPHMVVPMTLPPLVSDRSRRIRHGQEIRVASADLPMLVTWIPSLQRYIDELAATEE
jgi:hypothetical protein